MSNTKEDILRLQERANAGDASAQNSLGCAYHNADGVTRDYTKAKEWYLKAAAQKDSHAQSNLGILFHYGLGVNKNEHQAFRWYRKSALNGNLYGLFHLGEFYEFGTWVDKDIATAYFLYSKAEVKGHKDAKQKLSSLKTLYDPDVEIRPITCPLISKNIFRSLGVFSNYSSREVTSHKSRIKTFLSIGKKIIFENDKVIKSIFPDIYPQTKPLFEERTPIPTDSLYADKSIKEIRKMLQSNKDMLHTLSQSEIYFKYIRREGGFEEDLSLDEKLALQKIKETITKQHQLQVAYDFKRNEMLAPCREEKWMEKATNAIEDIREKLKYSFFWFISQNQVNQEEMKAIVKMMVGHEHVQDKSYASLVNMAVLAFLQGNDEDYVKYMTEVISIDEYRIDFANAVCGRIGNFTEKDLAQILIDALLEYLPNVNWLEIFENNSSSLEAVAYLKECLIKEPINKIEKVIGQTKTFSFKNGIEYNNALLNLKSQIVDCLDDFTDIINDKDDYRYIRLCDEACETIIFQAQSCYRAYSTTEYDCTRHCLALTKFAFNLARGAKAKNDAEDAYNDIFNIFKKLPPREIFQYVSEIRKCINESRNINTSNIINNETFKEIKDIKIDNALKLVVYCASRIVSLKETLDKNDELYIEISTEVVECALSIAIDVFNRDLKGFGELLKKNEEDSACFNDIYAADIQRKGQSISKMLSDCCILFADLDLFDMESGFASQRYAKNKNVILKQAKDFGLDPTSFYPSIDLRRDEEHFLDCSSRKDYEMYLKCHPNGKYTEEANGRLQRLKEVEAYEDAYWLECDKHKTYDAYLEKYPLGRYAKNAQKKDAEQSGKRQSRFALLFIFIILAIVISLAIFRTNTKEETSEPNKPKTSITTPLHNSEKSSDTYDENIQEESADPDRFDDVTDNDEEYTEEEESDTDVENDYDNNNDYE